MDERQQKQSTQQQQAGGKRSTITPAYNGPRRLAFRIRRRGFTFEGSPSLLISNCHGVWSVTHRRYIKKTRYHRFHDLKHALDPIRTQVYKQYKMNRWPQYNQDEELRSLRQKLADLYWTLMPEEEKARTVLLYHERRERRRRLCLERWRAKNLYAAAVVCMAVVGFVLMRLVLRGCYSVGVSLFLGSGYLLAAYLIDMAWHFY